MFHIWRIQSLKNDLRDRSLSSTDGLCYLLAYGIVSNVEPVLISPKNPSPFNMLDYIMSGAWLFVFVVGTVACYRANMADQGHDFLARYASLAWVLGVRWLVMVFIPTVVLVLALENNLGGFRRQTTLLEALPLLVMFIGFYWRLRYHFADLNRPLHSESELLPEAQPIA